MIREGRTRHRGSDLGLLDSLRLLSGSGVVDVGGGAGGYLV